MPALSAEQLAARLIQKKPLPAILLLGPDSFLRERCREQIIEALIDPAARQWSVKHFSGAEDSLETVVGQARMMPMLATRQVIVYSEIDSIQPPSEKSKKEDPSELLREYLKSPAPYSVLVLEASDLDKRFKLTKLLMEDVPIVEAALPSEPGARVRAAAQVAQQLAAREKSAIEKDAAQELAELCNCDLAMVRSELSKLITYAGPGNTISLADVEALVVSEKKYEVWDLTDALASGNLQSALEFLDQLLRDGAETPGVIGAMARTFRNLLEIKDMGRGLNAWQVAGQLRMPRDAAERAIRQAQKLSREELARAVGLLYEADSRLKSGSRNDRAIMEFLITSLVGGRTAAKPTAAPAAR
jgi:DNA polymerase III subunit delta